MICRNTGSPSAKRLSRELTNRLNYKVWRSRRLIPTRIQMFYGNPVDKIAQYKWFKDNNIPALEFTTDIEEAKRWAARRAVVCRRLINASNGRGIVVADTPEQVVPAKVYTKYAKKSKEFRVHIYKDKVVSILEKRRKLGATTDTGFRIRNHVNGFVFCRNNVNPPPGIKELALRASKVTNSDFKGVDIGYNELKDLMFIIEVNSAPGVEGTTVNEYCNTIIGREQAQPLVRRPRNRIRRRTRRANVYQRYGY